MAPIKEYYLSRRGDRNVPLRYIKGAEWVERREDQDLSPGYYALNDDSNLVPIEFDFEAIQWGVAEATPEGPIRVRRPAPIELNLRIFDEERVDRSQWGPRDGALLSKETPAPQFRFGSDNGDTPDPDLQIPATDKSEREEQSLLNWLNLSPDESTNPISPHSPDHLHWLLECHKSQQLPLELQQAYWPELLELEYPAEMEQEWPVIFDKDYRSQIMEEAEVEAILLEKEKEPTLHPIQTRETEAEEEAEEGEILETLEEGEIPRIPMQQE